MVGILVTLSNLFGGLRSKAPNVGATVLSMRLAAALLLFLGLGCNQPGRGRTDAGGDRPTDNNQPFVDSDNDRLPDSLEIGVNPASPRDSNLDGVPDYLDPDCDDDTILDGDEAFEDPDMDGTPNYLDRDSDADTVPDISEAGDTALETLPVDTDDDSTPDYLDPDADDDGLSDRREVMAGTDRIRSDSDGDDVSDLVEVAAGSDPLRGEDSPRTRGDFVFVVPYQEPSDPDRDTLDFATTIRSADIYFLMDTTGSMRTSIDSLRDNIRSFIPQVRNVLSDAYFGIGDFRDYPVTGYGNAGDWVYQNRASITNSMSVIEAALQQYNQGGGGDNPEGLIPALYAVATGNSLPGNSGLTTAATCPAGTFGYPCFRSNAVPIVVMITDDQTHNGPNNANSYSNGTVGGVTPSYSDTIAALNAANISVIGVGQGTTGEQHMRAIATATGSVNGSGQPFYSTWSGGSPIGNTVLSQIQALAMTARFDVSVRYVDDPSDAVDTWAAFVDRLTPNEAGDASRSCVARAASDTNADGVRDTFLAVQGQRVCFDVFSKQNDTVEPAAEPLLFRATIQVIGDGFTVLDERTVFFLVPPNVQIEIG